MPRKPLIKEVDAVPGAFFYLSKVAVESCPSLLKRLDEGNNLLASDHPVFIINKRDEEVNVMVGTSYNGLGFPATKNGVLGSDYHFNVMSGGTDADRMETSDSAKAKVYLRAWKDVLSAPTCIRLALYTIECHLLEPYMVNNQVQHIRLEDSSVERLREAARIVEGSKFGPSFRYSRLPALGSNRNTVSESDLAKAKQGTGSRTTTGIATYLGPSMAFGRTSRAIAAVAAPVCRV